MKCKTILKLMYPFQNKLKFPKKKRFMVPIFVLISTLSTMYCQNGGKYNETYRPQIHFSPIKDFMCDPNGLLYYKGEYHLFFQHDELGAKGKHSWGHAISKDLVHWKQLPNAINEQDGLVPASGSAVIDWNNTSGLGKNGEPPLIAFFAGVLNNKINQYLEYSNDSGISWTLYSKKPVVYNPENLRDPRVIWYEPEKKWVMITSGAQKVLFYESKNLKDWKKMSEFSLPSIGGGWECPELFQLAVDNNPKMLKWVLNINLTNSHGVAGDSGLQYFIGNFDGHKFHEEYPSQRSIHWGDYGRDFYAAQSFTGIPKSDGRRIWFGWMSSWIYAGAVPTKLWQGAQSIPRSLSLKSYSDGIRLVQTPVDELKKLRGRYFHEANIDLNNEKKFYTNSLLSGNTLEIEAKINFSPSSKFWLEVRKGANQRTVIGYDAVKEQLFIDRSKSGETKFSKDFTGRQTAPLSNYPRTLKLHVYVDNSSVEVFADDGKVVMTDIIFPSPTSSGVSFFADNGSIKITKLDAWNLKSIWNNN